jgi:hypothetical protein
VSVTASLRPMTEDERLRAKTLLTRHGWTVRHVVASAILLVLAALIGAFTGGAAMAIASQAVTIPFAWANRGIGSFAVLGTIAMAWWIVFVSRDRREGGPSLSDDVASGVVEVLEVEAFIAWADKDRVPSFLLDVAAEQPLHVKGECLLPLVEAGTFPCRRFTLVRLPATRKLLSLEPRGEPIPVRA